MEEEEEGGTAEKHIANTARQVSQDLHKYVVDKGEANMVNFTSSCTCTGISYLEKPQDVH